MQFVRDLFSGFGLNAFAQRVFDYSKPIYLIYFFAACSGLSMAIMLAGAVARQIHPNAGFVAAWIFLIPAMPVFFQHILLMIRAYFWLVRSMFSSVLWLFGWVADTSEDASKRNLVQQQRLKR